jgi:hypothetical protein
VIRDPNFSYRNISHTASRGVVKQFLHSASAAAVTTNRFCEHRIEPTTTRESIVREFATQASIAVA